MSYINQNCIYKIETKLNPNKVIKVDEKKLKPILHNKVNKGRFTKEDDDQNWYFDYYEKHKAYKIVNLKTKRILGYDSDYSEKIIMEDLDMESLYCHWTVDVKNDGYVVIRNAGDPKRVLDIVGSQAKNGIDVILFKETNGRNQRFKLIRHKFKDDYKYKEAEKLKNPHVQKENTYKNIDDLKHKLFSSEQFIKKWADIAELLGYNFCAGTRGINAGEDFKVTKLKNGNYVLKANYRAADPYAYEGDLSHRLEIQISDVKLTFDPHSIELDKPTITKLNPTVISTTKAVNRVNSEGTVTTEIEYTVGHTVSNSTSNTIANSISIENSFKLKIQGFKFEESFTYTFEHEKTWGYQEDKTIESKLKSIYSTPVPANSSMPIYALLSQSRASIPYKAKANIEYAVRFKGFLKRDNALIDKSIQHKIIEYSFGDGKVPATKFLEKEYSNRDVHDNKSGWDYTWSILNNDPEYFNERMSEAITQDEVEISGIFTDIASTDVTIVAGKKPDKDDYKSVVEKDSKNNDDLKDKISFDIEFINSKPKKP